jgi:hypothetical protein
MLRKLSIRPGISREASQAASEGGWWAANRVRFRGGWPEKLGGWVRDTAQQFSGTVRALLVWASLRGQYLTAVGSSQGVWVRRGSGEGFEDRSPVLQTLLTCTASATVGVPVITITTAVSHGLSVGDVVMYDVARADGWGTWGIPTMVGGVPLLGRYVVGAVVSATQFSISTASAPTSSVVNQAIGTVYQVDVGAADQAANSAIVDVRFWSFDAWGEQLLGVPRRGRLYRWRPVAGVGLTPTDPDYLLLPIEHASDAAAGPPRQIGLALVAQPQRQVIALGASSGTATGPYDPLLVRWSDVEDYTVWVASSTNQAGSVRLQGGAEIIGGRVSRGQVLVWTEASLYAMRYIGQPLIYRVDLVGQNCGLIGPSASAEVAGVVYWMSTDGFFAFRGGAPELLPCPLWDDVWRDLSREQHVKVVAGGNSLFSEVWWFYPPEGSSEPTKYVAYDTVAGLWHGGDMERTAWCDRGLQDRPLAAASTTVGGARLYQHEVGVDADGAAMGEWIESGWVDIDDGESMVFVDKLVPDWRRLVGSARLTVRAQDRNDAAVKVRGPAVVVPGTRQVPVRVRGRQMSLRIDGSTTPGGDWRLGALRTDAQPDGKQ